MKSINKLSLVIAAALAGTVLTSVSASAATTTLSVGGTTVTTGTVATNPTVLPVPSDNKVDSADALKVSISGSDITGISITAVATNATIVTALHTDTASVTSNSGASTVTIATGTGTTAEFYVYTKTTNAGTVVVSFAGTSVTYYVKGSAGAAYNLSLTAPDTLNTNTSTKIYAKTTDIFGNPVTTSTPSVTSIGATVGSVSVSDTATGTFAFDLSAPTTVGTIGLSVGITATDISGLAAAAKTSTKFIAVTNLADALASANAQIAALNAQLAAANLAKANADAAAAKAVADLATAKATADIAAATYKLEYNKLATAWNKKFPKSKVELKK
jgi:hypothetical protein